MRESTDGSAIYKNNRTILQSIQLGQTVVNLFSLCFLFVTQVIQRTVLVYNLSSSKLAERENKNYFVEKRIFKKVYIEVTTRLKSLQNFVIKTNNNCSSQNRNCRKQNSTAIFVWRGKCYLNVNCNLIVDELYYQEMYIVHINCTVFLAFN